jgi:dihydropteroate synthase
VVEALAADGARVSIDTRKPAVARAAVAAGATLLNDVVRANGAVAAELGVAWAAMHVQGEPATMQDAPRYDDVVAEVLAVLVERADAAGRAGVPEVWIDPGIGFGKTPPTTSRCSPTSTPSSPPGYPVLVGTSRKGFLGPPARRLRRHRRPPPSTTGSRVRSPPPPGRWPTGARMVRVPRRPAPLAHAALVIGGQITKEAA